MVKYFLCIAWCLVSCQQKNKKISTYPEVTDITELVYASVIVKPRVSYFPQPTRSGVIKKVYVNEGEKVDKGQLLAVISASADVTGNLASAKINLEEATENFLGKNNLVRNIDLELQSLREQLSSDSLNYFRQKDLWSQNIGKKAELEQYELAYKISQKKYEALQQKKAQTINELESRYKRALTQAKTEQSQLQDFTLRSTIPGVVYALNKEEGEFISSQDRLAEIGSVDSFKIEMDIDEEDITKIELGDTVVITLDAYGNEIFLALVSNVFPRKDEASQTFRVESIFLQQPPKLYYGLSGEANIIVNKKHNVLVIPSEYLMDGDKVLTESGEINVTTGLKNMKFVEILSGIDTSTSIVKPQE